jgi:hypothetical protein
MVSIYVCFLLLIKSSHHDLRTHEDAKGLIRSSEWNKDKNTMAKRTRTKGQK